MATIAPAFARADTRDRFFPMLAIAMAGVIVTGFVVHYLMGLSTFRARPLVHAHGIVFMSWVALFVVQAHLGAGASPALHRRIGWFAAGWSALLVVLGTSLMIDVVRRGTAPFFFQPQQMMLGNILSLSAFAAFTAAAIRMRRRTDWHRRLHVCALAMISGPGFGRLLPMPFLTPYAFEIAAGMGALFMIAGVIHDRRALGRVHPAWLCGLATLGGVLLLARVIAFSPAGDALYAAVTAGSPGAHVPGLAFPPPPAPGNALRGKL